MEVAVVGGDGGGARGGGGVGGGVCVGSGGYGDQSECSSQIFVSVTGLH